MYILETIRIFKTENDDIMKRLYCINLSNRFCFLNILLGGVYMNRKNFSVLLMLTLILVMLTGCKDSHGKELKLSVSDHTVMLNENFQAHVHIKTNKDATYELLKGDKTIQSSRKTTTGSANIKFVKPGKYTIKVQSDNKHATKTQNIRVKPCDITVNKTTSAVGPMKFTIKHIKYERVKKVKKSQVMEDAENNMEDYDMLRNPYYRVVVTYELINDGDKSIDPQYTTYNPIDDSGRTFSEDGGSDAYAFDSIIGTSKIQPHTRRTGTVVMISNHHFTVKNLKFEVGEIWANDDDQLSDGGVASLD